MLIAVAVLLALMQSGRPYHDVPLEQVIDTTWTHVRTCGVVTYTRRLADGDLHVTLSQGAAFVVLEIIPALPMPAPRKGQRIEAWGIVRIDRRHRPPQYRDGWPELHPLEGWTPVDRCRQRGRR